VTADKPPYRIPTMPEIRALPWNGYSVASTFAGCGGSSTGYRMAGYRVLYANECVEAAADSYRANAAPYTHVDTRDIRTVTAPDILEICGLERGQLDLFDGSPPCDSFSTAGMRDRGWGKVKTYSGTTQRTDDLTWEFVRLLEGLAPRVFVMENVSGLLKGKAKGYFIEMMRSLKAAGYTVGCRLLDAQWLGVAQARQRAIFVGVRNDLAGVAPPAHPLPLPYNYTVRDAFPHIAQIGTSTSHDVFAAHGRDVASTLRPSDSQASPTIMGSGPNKGAGIVVDDPATLEQLRAIHNTSGAPGWSVGDFTDRAAPTVTTWSHHYQVDGSEITHDPETGQDLRIGKHAIGPEAARLNPGQVSGKYQSLIRADLERPSPTVTASAGSVATAGVVAPSALRKFTLGELRAICGFPPDFVLTGSYQDRWNRLGLAVPPMMMCHIAGTVRDAILTRLDEEAARGRAAG